MVRPFNKIPTLQLFINFVSTIAWNFHHTAYQERIQAVEASLSVIENLQRYRPKRHYPKAPSGARTPHRFSAPFHPNDIHLLSSRLNEVTNRPSFSQSPSLTTAAASDQGHDADIEEEGEGTLVGELDCGLPTKTKKLRKTMSWFKRKKKPTEPEPISLKELAPDEQAKEVKQSHVRIMEPAHFEGVHIHAPSPMPSRPGSPSFTHTRTHRRGGSEANDRTIVQAARALKSAVLHDARNIRGQDQDLSNLSWNVNSSLEAKVSASATQYSSSLTS